MSTIFLIVLCAMLSIIAAKSDYIAKADEVYHNLREFEEQFESEAQVINYAKCVLIRKEELEDFNIGGINVTVYQDHDGYVLHYLDYVMNLSVYEDQIIAFNVHR